MFLFSLTVSREQSDGDVLLARKNIYISEIVETETSDNNCPLTVVLIYKCSSLFNYSYTDVVYIPPSIPSKAYEFFCEYLEQLEIFQLNNIINCGDFNALIFCTLHIDRNTQAIYNLINYFNLKNQNNMKFW